MEQLVINIKNKRKLSFVLELFKQFDFIEVVKKSDKIAAKDYDFFASAGLWENRQIELKDLRDKAWKK